MIQRQFRFFESGWIVTVTTVWACYVEGEECGPDVVPYGHDFCRWQTAEMWERAE